MSTDKNEKVKPKEIFLNRNKELSKACSGEPGSRDGGLENRDSGAKCRYPIFKLEKLRQKSNRREFANDRQITCVLDWTFEFDLKRNYCDLQKDTTIKTYPVSSSKVSLEMDLDQALEFFQSPIGVAMISGRVDSINGKEVGEGFRLGRLFF